MRTARPDISETRSIEASEFLDENQGADYELLVDDKWQYVFQESDRGLQFIAFAQQGDPKLSGHPDLHECTVPEEIQELFVRSYLTQPINGSHCGDRQPIEMQGRVDVVDGPEMILIEDPERPSHDWKNAASIVKELGLGTSALDIGSRDSEPYPPTTVEQDDTTMEISFSSRGARHTYRFSIGPDGETVCRKK